LPHVILTEDADWDPGVLDLDLDEQEAWFDAMTNLPTDRPPSTFDEFGDYDKRVVMQNHDVLYSWDTSQHVIDACVMVHTYNAQSLNPSHPPAPDPEDTDLDILPTLYVSFPQDHQAGPRLPGTHANVWMSTC